MNDEYLWDGSGEPDEQVVALERLLAPLHYRERSFARRRWPLMLLLTAAAAVICLVSVSVRQRHPVTAWQLASGSRLRVGQWIESSGSTPVVIASDRTGAVQIEPGSRLRLVAATDRRQHFSLVHGTIHALIWAPPGHFVVDTPSARTIDLGCRYTLHVARDGAGLLTVELGLTRTRDAQRAEVFHRLAALAPLPDSISRAAILEGNPAAFDEAWNALHLGSAQWWREWKKQW